MELQIQWFWLVQLAFLFTIMGSLYMGWKKAKATNKAWNIWTTISVILIVIQYMAPIKMSYPPAAQQAKYSHKIMKVTSVPERANNNLTPKSTDNLKITKEELQ